MSYTFRPAVREQVGLLMGVVGPSGSGKTYSAMRLAAGIVGKGNRFAVIDTEARRALHYADIFQFDHCQLDPPFRPDSYAEAIKAADKAGYKAIVVDSMSHEWAGEGGVLDWQDNELTRMAGDDWKKRETCKMAAWIKPKMSHKQMVQRLLQVQATLILCFRAEEKVKMEKDAQNKTVIVPIGWQPICSKELPYELTVSFLLTPEKPGYPQPLKLQEQHKSLFPLDKLLNEESGKRIAEWASGGATPPLVESKIKALLLAELRKQGGSDSDLMEEALKNASMVNGKYLTFDRLQKYQGGDDRMERWLTAALENLQQPVPDDIPDEPCELCQQVNGHTDACPNAEPPLLEG